MNSNLKLIKNIKKTYSFIFKNQQIKELIAKHYDKKGGMLLFLLELLNNRLSVAKALKHIQTNLGDWLTIFASLYEDEQIVKMQYEIIANPIINFESILSLFDAFDNFVNKFITFVKECELNLNINEQGLKVLLINTFGYLAYNSVDCKVHYDVKKNLLDPKYETKFTIVLNNTKLFALAKKSILECCGSDVNNLISLLLGVTKKLNYDY